MSESPSSSSTSTSSQQAPAPVSLPSKIATVPIVHYVNHVGKHVPAALIELLDETVGHAALREFEYLEVKNVPYSPDGKEPGTWHAPEKA